MKAEFMVIHPAAERKHLRLASHKPAFMPWLYQPPSQQSLQYSGALQWCWLKA